MLPTSASKPAIRAGVRLAMRTASTSRDARQAVERPQAVVQSHDAGGQRLAVGHDADAVAAQDRLAAVAGAKEVFAIGHVQGPVAVGHQRQAVGPLDLVRQPQQFALQVLAVGDDLGRQLVEVQRGLQEAAAAWGRSGVCRKRARSDMAQKR